VSSLDAIRSENLVNHNHNRESDIIYIESWKAAVAECDRQLEPQDHERALQVKNIADFRHELERLLQEYPDDDDAPHHVIMLLLPALEHYEQFTQSFVRMMARKVETSMLWGLLYLVVKVSIPFWQFRVSLQR
jgi:hypothetical protein